MAHLGSTHVLVSIAESSQTPRSVRQALHLRIVFSCDAPSAVLSGLNNRTDASTQIAMAVLLLAAGSAGAAQGAATLTAAAQPASGNAAASAASASGYSTLWGKDGELWKPSGPLPDFSFAGEAAALDATARLTPGTCRCREALLAAGCAPKPPSCCALAGYHQGNDPLPSPPVTKSVLDFKPGSRDDTEMLVKAVEWAHKQSPPKGGLGAGSMPGRADWLQGARRARRIGCRKRAGR